MDLMKMFDVSSGSEWSLFNSCWPEQSEQQGRSNQNIMYQKKEI